MSPAHAEKPLSERFERIRANLEQIQQAERWPRTEISREGEHHFSVRIEPVQEPRKDST